MRADLMSLLGNKKSTHVSLHLTFSEVHKQEDRMEQQVKGGSRQDSLSLHWVHDLLCACGLDVCFAALLDQ